jgi:hypothetical protein
MHLGFNNTIKGAIIIVLWTLIVFSPSLNNGFVDYDDSLYMSENPLIHDFSWAGLGRIFSDDKSNLFPLPMITMAIEYHFFKLNPAIYHIDNLGLHLINALCVYILVQMLSNSIGISFLTAMFFAINPLRVESVAWIAERKDVLCTFFYLWSLIMYVCAVKGYKLKGLYLTGSYLLFFCSLLSKPQAFTLPLVLVAIDFLYDRVRWKNFWTEKAPFFFMIILFYYSVFPSLTHRLIAINSGLIGLTERILFACNALLIYILKNFIPYQLSCLYSFPHKLGGRFPLIVYGAPVILLCVGYLSYKLFKGNRLVVFGMLFFLINIVIPLRLIWYNWFVGEHYMYLPSIGLSLALSVVVVSLLKSAKRNAVCHFAFVIC